MSDSWETVDLTSDDGVATITIDRPDRLNAMNVETLEAFHEAVRAAEKEGARVLVIAGAGEKSFIAGADIGHMRDLSTPEAQGYAELGHDLCDAIEAFPGPVIAAINGYAFGGGCEIALACDFRIASERALLGQTEIDLGIIPGWGGTQRLSRLVGDDVARKLVFFGERVDAQDAYEYGLVSTVVAHDELEEHVSGMAADLAARPAYALRAAKEALNQVHESPQSAGLAYERRLWSSLFGTHDQREGMAAFVEDREPEFE